MARFFVPKENIEGDHGSVSGQELEHLRKVLRKRPGDSIILFDDQGWEHEAVIQSYGRGTAELKIVNSYRVERESALQIILAQGLSKGEKMDWVVEKATELGVGTILPFVSSHTVPRLDGPKMKKRQERWKKIALSAAKQSGRIRVPEILEAVDFYELIHRDWPCDSKLICWERESHQGLAQMQTGRAQIRSLLLAIGPEGGFSPEEADEAVRCGFQSIRLGKRILRTETAALAAISLVQFLWGDMG